MLLKQNWAATALGVAAIGFVTCASADDLPATKLHVIASASNSNIYKALEEPFWKKVVPEASNGQVTADVTTLTESGMKGPEIVRLLGTGALDVAYGDLGSVAGDDPSFEGLDLAGVITDMDTLNKAAEAYKPVMAPVFARHGIKLMALLPFPAQAFFCRGQVASLDDLKGKKVRTYTRSSSEFVTEIGATPVTIPFPDVIPALQTGVADCAITGTFSGNTARWFEVTDSLFTLPLGGTLSFYGFNAAAWDKLDPKVQALLTEQFAAFEKQAWDLAKGQTQEGINCDTGTGDCTHGTKGKMTLHEPSDADRARAHEAATKVVLPSWAKRCGADCAAAWNGSVGKVVGATAE